MRKDINEVIQVIHLLSLRAVVSKRATRPSERFLATLLRQALDLSADDTPTCDQVQKTVDSMKHVS